VGDPELDAQVQRFERRLQPRARAEIEAEIAKARETWAPRIERYNYLLERKERCEIELGQLRPSVEQFDALSHDLDWEYFRRLQLDGALPTLPRLTPEATVHRYHDLRVGQPTDDNHKNDGAHELLEETEEDGWNEPDFEVGSKG
jgi:hypothetical protein